MCVCVCVYSMLVYIHIYGVVGKSYMLYICIYAALYLILGRQVDKFYMLIYAHIYIRIYNDLYLYR
jgi:hypothetical protein